MCTQTNIKNNMEIETHNITNMFSSISYHIIKTCTYSRYKFLRVKLIYRYSNENIPSDVRKIVARSLNNIYFSYQSFFIYIFLRSFLHFMGIILCFSVCTRSSHVKCSSDVEKIWYSETCVKK